MDAWLRDQLEAARVKAEADPAWLRESEWLFDPAQYPPQWTCVHRHRCREAQTCAGKPCRAPAPSETP